MRLSHLIEDKDHLTLYHGTLKSHVPSILRQGLKAFAGCVTNTEGVYLSGSIEGAKYWALYAYCVQQLHIDFERTDPPVAKEAREMNNIVILKVNIPNSKLINLRADMEQAEDYNFDEDEKDWQASLEHMGDLMYDGNIPPNWISVL